MPQRQPDHTDAIEHLRSAWRDARAHAEANAERARGYRISATAAEEQASHHAHRAIVIAQAIRILGGSVKEEDAADATDAVPPGATSTPQASDPTPPPAGVSDVGLRSAVPSPSSSTCVEKHPPLLDETPAGDGTPGVCTCHRRDGGHAPYCDLSGLQAVNVALFRGAKYEQERIAAEVFGRAISDYDSSGLLLKPPPKVSGDGTPALSSDFDTTELRRRGYARVGLREDGTPMNVVERMREQPKRCGACTDCCSPAPLWCESWGPVPEIVRHPKPERLVPRHE